MNGVSIPKLLNNPFTSCSFTNLEFLNRHSVHFDCIVNLPFFVLKTIEFNFSFTLRNKSPCSLITSLSKKTEDKFLIHFLHHIFLQFHE